MSLPVPLHRYPYPEYVTLEEHSPVRHEFVAGEIYAMPGGTPAHAALAASVLRHLGNQLPAGCRAYTSDLRVRVATSDATTYPDGAVVCGLWALEYGIDRIHGCALGIGERTGNTPMELLLLNLWLQGELDLPDPGALDRYCDVAASACKWAGRRLASDRAATEWKGLLGMP